MYLLIVVLCLIFLFTSLAFKIIDFVIYGKKEKELVIDISSVSDVEETENRIFRPSTFDEYIGQAKAKNQLKDYIKAVQERNETLGHTIISGLAGGGKTTLANIIANELGAKFVETIASSIDNIDTLRDLIEQTDGGILFIDEIHGADRDLVETIYMAMEDFKIDGEKIKPFTLVGATTELGEILKDRKPFYERFEIRLELEDYNHQELGKIAKQWKNTTYPNDEIKENIYNLIGKNSRGAPRTAIRFTKATVLFNGNINSILKNNQIIKEGYTIKDLKTLEYIAENEKGVGLNGLVCFLNTSKANYNYEIEPYLVQKRLILKTPRGRKITETGIKKIEELKGVTNETV